MWQCLAHRKHLETAVSSPLTPTLFTAPKRKMGFDLEERGQGNLGEEPCLAGGECKRGQGLARWPVVVGPDWEAWTSCVGTGSHGALGTKEGDLADCNGNQLTNVWWVTFRFKAVLQLTEKLPESYKELPFSQIPQLITLDHTGFIIFSLYILLFFSEPLES